MTRVVFIPDLNDPSYGRGAASWTFNIYQDAIDCATEITRNWTYDGRVFTPCVLIYNNNGVRRYIDGSEV